MRKTSFENLVVYQLAAKLSDVVWGVVKEWPRFERETVGRQLVRSADSVGANLAEGAGRGSEADNRRFVHIARGSLYETKHWLRRAWERELLAKSDIAILRPKMDELIPRLNAYLNYVSGQC